MSVMECNRKGCMHIMCRRYSTEFGYICSDCYGELERLLERAGSRSNYHLLTRQFMNTEKQEAAETVQEYLEEEFDIGDDDEGVF